MPPPAKKPRLLDDSDDNGSADEGSASEDLSNGFELRVNPEYAQRFEHNKKREEMHRLEEKLGKPGALKNPKGLKGQDHDDSESEASGESTSDSEEEDDEGELATEALDAEISATLRAIQSKDPRVYDQNITFYTRIDHEDTGEADDGKAQKPIYLQDYHRANLLNGTSEQNGDGDVPVSFAQGQEDLKRNILGEIEAAEVNCGTRDSSDEKSSTTDDFMVVKKPVARAKAVTKPAVPDVEVADKDPETFLSNFMASRAWVPTGTSRFQPLESDDEEEEHRADEYEEAYNFRFEDPSRANEKLMSHAREATSKYSVRREEPNKRKKQRDTERTKKDLVKQGREEDRARLRKLKVDEVESKVKKIKKAAGLSGSRLDEDDWAKFLEDGWDDEKWGKEMAQRFNDAYYAEKDYESGEIDEEDLGRRKAKKPKWTNEIDIKDLVPEFRDEEDADFSLSDVDDNATGKRALSKSKKKQRLQQEQDRKKEARKDRKRIEQIVDRKLDLDNAVLPTSSKGQSAFRYRDTSPLSYGLTANDILMADDSQLNQYAGLKKLASFRDTEKKRKDQKKLGKKARLRQWRKETFGNESGPRESLDDYWRGRERGESAGDQMMTAGVDIREGGKKRNRSKRSKRQAIEAST